VELGERIIAWWLLFILDRGATFICQRPLLLPDDRIRTSWPQSREEYERGNLYPTWENTVASLYDDESTASSARGNCTLAMHAKCFALIERATSVGSRAVSAADPEFKRTNNAIMRFIDTLPPIYDIEERRDQTTVPQAQINTMMVYVHTVALGAILQLHDGLARKGDEDSYAKCMGAAASITNIIYAAKRLKSTVVFRPMGVVWVATKSLLERELAALQSVPKPDRIRIERLRLDLDAITWAFSQIHNDVQRYGINQHNRKPSAKRLESVRAVSASYNK